ncbi:phosphoribosylglycinamide formyltransferase 2 [Gordonia westfalica]|uniref:Phosphoribosylglycinamide formyltransferase 2 n=1 Tax=Gordonia westfalica TaxID=158898 RepID=A0A1H2LKQ3_9ACTN|nr:phosphoribosylglycinamide formyltransferase 2 [Gordonia westfalica]
MTSNSDSATSADQPAPTIGPPDVIGTPLSPTATKVMVLGAGELGKEVVIAFQRLGVEVVAVDRYANAPGQQVAHHAEVIDMTDPEALLAVIDKHRPAYVVPEIEAIATEALVDVAERGVAEVIPTASAVVATMNREGIRRLADEELGLPTSPYLFADTLEELAEAAGQIGFPCVVKPVMSSSGKGQSVLRGPDDVASAWETANTGGRVQGNRVIVEGFIEFDYEITLLAVRAIDPRTGSLTSHFCAPIGHRQINGDYVESWQPHEMSPDAHASATSIAARIATALGDGKLAGRGVFGVELFVKGTTSTSPRSVRGRTTPVSSPWRPSGCRSSRCTPARFSACPSTSRWRRPAPRRSSTDNSTRPPSDSRTSPRHSRCPRPTSACSASRRASTAGAWVWSPRPPTTFPPPANAPCARRRW